MRRRGLLSLAAALAGGCLSTAQTDAPARPSAPESLPPSGDAALSGFDPGAPFDTRTVGEPGGGRRHRVVVWNDDAGRRTIRVRLRPLGSDDAAVEADPVFPAYGSLRVGVYRRTDYVLEVGPPGRRRAVGVPRTAVDCSDSATHVAVRPDGSVRARMVTAALRCDAPADAAGDDADVSTP